MNEHELLVALFAKSLRRKLEELGVNKKAALLVLDLLVEACGLLKSQEE